MYVGFKQSDVSCIKGLVFWLLFHKILRQALGHLRVLGFVARVLFTSTRPFAGNFCCGHGKYNFFAIFITFITRKKKGTMGSTLFSTTVAVLFFALCFISLAIGTYLLFTCSCW